jgi:hypothetical protein
LPNVRRAPLGDNQILVFQPLQSDIERSMIHKKYLFGLALNQARHALSVARAEDKALEDQKVECSLQQGDTIVVILSGSHSTQVFTSLGRMSTRAKKIKMREQSWGQA